MSIPTRIAAFGYQLYRSLGIGATRTDLDALLARHGMPPVSNRMYDHYGRLLAAGRQQYEPINRFDVRRAMSRRQERQAG